MTELFEPGTKVRVLSGAFQVGKEGLVLNPDALHAAYAVDARRHDRNLVQMPLGQRYWFGPDDLEEVQETVVPPGQTFNTDQRLAILLVATVEKLSGEKQRLQREADQWDDAGMTEILLRQRGHISNIYDRAVEISEALADGRLEIKEKTS